jgi:hypothetical protein
MLDISPLSEGFFPSLYLPRTGLLCELYESCPILEMLETEEALIKI